MAPATSLSPDLTASSEPARPVASAPTPRPSLASPSSASAAAAPRREPGAREPGAREPGARELGGCVSTFSGAPLVGGTVVVEPLLIVGRAAPTPPAAVGARGDFAFAGLRPNRYRVSALDARGFTVAQQEVELTAVGAWVDLVGAEPAHVRCRVLGGDAVVEVRHQHTRARGLLERLPDGTFAGDVPPGPYWIVAHDGVRTPDATVVRASKSFGRRDERAVILTPRESCEVELDLAHVVESPGLPDTSVTGE